MKRAYECVNLGYVPTSPAFVPVPPKRPRRKWTMHDLAACFILENHAEYERLLASMLHLYTHYSEPLDDGYKCKDFGLIVAHALYLFNRAQLKCYMGAVVCLAIAIKMHDDYSPENAHNVYQKYMDDGEKKRFGALESHVFLEKLKGRVVFPSKDILKHWQLCARMCNAPMVPVGVM